MPGFFDKQLIFAKDEILRALNQLEVREAFQLFIAHRLPFNAVLAGEYTTAMHKLIRFRAFDFLRGFLRLVAKHGREALKDVLVNYKCVDEDLRLVDTAMCALLDEMEASEKRGERELPITVKKWAGVVYFLMKITGELPDPCRFRAWGEMSMTERERALGFCKKAYERLFTPEQREKWEAEFGVVLREEASPRSCALAR